MSGFNLADALDAVAETCAAQEALVQGSQRRTWAELERRARNLAAWMIGCGASRQGKVAIYTYNHPAYMEGVYAAMKAALVPVNVNYRYREEELRYLLDNADAEIVVVHAEFVPVLRAVAGQLPQLRGVLVIGDGSTPSLDGLRQRRALRHGRRAGPAGAGGDALPRRSSLPVHRRHDRHAEGRDVAPGAISICASPAADSCRRPTRSTRCAPCVANPPIPMRALIGPPLMHGTGWFTGVIAWLGGRHGGHARQSEALRCRTSSGRWSSASGRPAITIVGDSFAKPMIRALKEATPPYDLSSLTIISSSGVMWSQETKAAFLAARAAAHADRLLQLFGSRRHGAVDHHRGGRRADRHLPVVRHDAPVRRGAAAGRRGAGRERPGRRRRPAAGWVLQGPGEERAHLRRDAARPLLGAWRLGGGERRRPHVERCSAAARCASTPAGRRSSRRRSRRS